MKILFFSERLRPPYDEGIKNFAVHLIKALVAEHEVLALTSGGLEDTEYGIENVDVNRMLLSIELYKIIRRFGPQAIIYVPTACGTVFSFARAKVLCVYGGGAKTILIALQPRHYTILGKLLLRLLAPYWVLAQSVRTMAALRDLGCRVALFSPAVDTQRFRPALPAERAALRDKYGIDNAAIVVTHVGHLKGKRNLSHLLTLRIAGGYHTIVVGSTSTVQDEALKQTLCDAGVMVIDQYIANIEDIYRLSDAYLFLAEEDTAAIELPLSVLEAMACNLPVICKPFGGLPDWFSEGHGLYYWDGRMELCAMVEMALSAPCATRSLVESRTWYTAARELVHLLQSAEVSN